MSGFWDGKGGQVAVTLVLVFVGVVALIAVVTIVWALAGLVAA